MLREINFDGMIGPSHNFSGLSPGNLAATHNAGTLSHPRDAALQGIAKMRAALALGLVQGILPPHDRPNIRWLDQLGTAMASAGPRLRSDALSASAMWAANAATVSPAPDTADGLCHLTVANLQTMAHRSHEWPQTLAQLRIAFADSRHFAVHGPIPPPFGDEGAANHMRLASSHDAHGVELFIYGVGGGPYPARQHREASEAIARIHRLDPRHVLFAEQSPAAIAAGAFHNDVVAVANENVLLVHEQAFTDMDAVCSALQERLSSVVIEQIPAAMVSLDDAVATYLLNAQLVTLPEGGMALIVPKEAHDHPRVAGWLGALLAKNGPVRRVVPVDVRQSMANGGGPACLRLRVVADPQTIDPRFLVDPARLDRIEALVRRLWPVSIDPGAIGDPALWRDLRRARTALLEELGLSELDRM